MNFTKVDSVVIEVGILSFPALHDADILSFSKLSLDNPNDFEVIFKCENGEHWKFQAAGVRYFNCQNISHQNIVFDVEILSGTEFVKEIETNSNAYGLQWKGDIELLIEDIRKENLQLVQFQPSVGACLIIMAKSFEFWKQSDGM